MSDDPTQQDVKAILARNLQSYHDYLAQKLVEIKEKSIPLTQRRGVFLVPHDGNRDPLLHSREQIIETAIGLAPTGVTMIDFEPIIEPEFGFLFIVYRITETDEVGYAMYYDDGATATGETMDADRFIKVLVPDDTPFESLASAVSWIGPIASRLMAITD